jgi:uncharacterized protein YcfJ
MNKQANWTGWIVSTLLFSTLAEPVSAQTKEGAVLGGLTGAVIGGIVGHQNHETPEGALIGGAVGAIAGGVIGNHRQQQQQIQYYQNQSRYHHQHYCPPPTYVQVQPTTVYSSPTYVVPARPVVVRRPVSVQDVITLTRNRVNETSISQHIRTTGIASPVSTDDILTMSDAGVSAFIISEMQHAPTAAALAGATTSQASTVIVREEVYTPIDQVMPISGATQPSYQRSSQQQSVPAYRQRF